MNLLSSKRQWIQSIIKTLTFGAPSRRLTDKVNLRAATSWWTQLIPYGEFASYGAKKREAKSEKKKHTKKMFSPSVTTFLLILVSVSLREAVIVESQSIENKDFYDACAHGDLKRVKEFLDGDSGE